MATPGGSSTDNSKDSTKGRVLLQQCLSARLMVAPATADSPAQYVEISRGLVAYVCFLKGATQDLIEKMAKSVVGIRLSSSDEGKMVSIADLPGDLLIIPQATLGGRPKGKVMQYHLNIDKDTGRQLYQEFCEACQRLLCDNKQWQENNLTIKHGTYGNLQVLKLDTNGPFSHLMEF